MTRALTLVLLLALVGGCKQTLPSREAIPILKQKLEALHLAVKARDAVAVDTLLHDDLRDEPNVTDSLFRFVYGQDYSMPFDHFGNCEIVYVEDRARADCYLVDTSGARPRRVTFTFATTRGRWYLKGFGESDLVDSTAAVGDTLTAN